MRRARRTRNESSAPSVFAASQIIVLVSTLVIVAACSRGFPPWCDQNGRCLDAGAPRVPVTERNDCAGGETVRFRSRNYLSLSNPAGSSEHETPPYDPSLDLPEDASFSGWSDGERELWAPAGFEMLRRKGTSFIYLKYDDHTERWPEMRFGCM